jgi:hypothetical protein
MTSIPIWVRVPAIIALVLVGVVIGTALLGSAGNGGGHGAGGGGGHGPSRGMEMRGHDGGQGGHGRGDQTEMRDHGERHVR